MNEPLKRAGSNLFRRDASVSGRFSRIEPAKLHLINVKIGQGAQILRFPQGSVIRNITLEGGASHKSRWAVLRGAVLKLAPEREQPVVIDGKNFTVPTGHTLMDLRSFQYAMDVINSNKKVPYICVDNISDEWFYLVHASYCHPDQLFLPQGHYTSTKFFKRSMSVEHMRMVDGALLLVEDKMPLATRSFDILEGSQENPRSIIVQLKEGGHIVLRS